MTRSFVLFLALMLWASSSLAFSAFQVKEIRLEGLQRIASSTVLNYLPVKEGDVMTDRKSDQALRALFQTGFFNDVQLSRDGDVLVVTFVERPSISKIKLSGNEAIESEELKDGLKRVGLAEGRVFNRSLLEKVEQELQRQYFALGKYAVQINSLIKEQPRNRVSVDIEIEEGEVARVREINLIGNQAFSDATLLAKLQTETYELGDSTFGDSEYSRQKLAADLETMRSYYLDRGYINFDILSTQVTISPDKRDVYITVNVTEGGEHMVSKVGLSGELIVEEAELASLIELQPGDVFSRKVITESSTRISERLGEEGYAFANVNAIPEVDKENKQVALTFFVDPGKRVYIRRINFVGNTKTHDEVLRRELRQLEGGWYSTTKINRSKVRIQRTGFIEDVSVNRVPVPGRPDLVDVVFSVTERPSGSITASLGYGQGSGMILAASVNQNNFLGTGKRVSAEVNNSDVNRIYSFRMTDPYYTLDGVSRSMRVYLRETNADAATSIAGYNADVYGASITYGFPLSEYRTARMGVGYDNTSLSISESAPNVYTGFTDDYGTSFNTYNLNASLSFDTRNRIVFAEKGMHATLATEVAVPGGDLTFHKTSYRHAFFWPVYKQTVFHLNTLFAYGDGFGDTGRLPFYEHYYAGGGQSVRGFRDNSLGPRDEDGDRTIGGNRKFTGTAEVIIPPPLSEDSKSVRLSAFIDAGNVWGSNEVVDPDDVRSAYGLSFVWITPVGALRFSWAWALRTKPGDETQRFQFSIGAPF